MVIEISKDGLMPNRRRSDAIPPEPAIRRMRYGSIKSRSYDHAGDRRRRGVGNAPQPVNYPQNYGQTGPTVLPGQIYSSLDRRGRDYSLPPYTRQYDRNIEPGAAYGTNRSYGISAGRSYGQDYPHSARDYPKREVPYDQSGPSYDPYETGRIDYRRTISDEYSGRDPYSHWNDYPPQKDPRDERDNRYEQQQQHPPYEDERYPQRSALRRDYQPPPQRYPEQNQYPANPPLDQYDPSMMQQQLPQQTTNIPPARYAQQQQQMMALDDR